MLIRRLIDQDHVKNQIYDYFQWHPDVEAISGNGNYTAVNSSNSCFKTAFVITKDGNKCQEF